MVRDAVQRSSDRRQITQHAPQRAGATDVWLGNDGVYATREAVVRCIRSLLGYTTTSDADADRSIFVGPPDRWIFVGDSAGSTEDADPDAFDSLSNCLSFIAPTLSVKMSASAIVHLQAT